MMAILAVMPLAVAAPLVLGWSGAQPTGPELGPLREFLERVTPKTGAVEASFTQPNGRFEVRVGFDFATGAWFRTTYDMVLGQTPEGEFYSGGRVVPRNPEAPPDPSAAIAIVDFIPSVWLVLLRDHPVLVQRATRTDGGFLIDVGPTPDGRGPPTIHVRIDQAGRVESMTRDDFPPERNRPLEYRPDTPAFAPLPVDLPGVSLRLAWFRAGAELEPDAFSRARVESVASQIRLDVEKAMAAASEAARRAGGGAGPPGPAPAPPAPASPGERWRWPLIGAGIVFVLIGAGAIVWSRRR